MIITVYVYIKKVSHLPSQLGIFVFTFTVKRFHIYEALLHLALKVFTFTGPYYIFTFRGATQIFRRRCPIMVQNKYQNLISRLILASSQENMYLGFLTPSKATYM